MSPTQVTLHTQVTILFEFAMQTHTDPILQEV